MDQRRMESNLFVSEGGRWKRLRAIIATIFTTGKMRQMEPIVADSIKHLIALLHRQRQPGIAIDIKQFDEIISNHQRYF